MTLRLLADSNVLTPLATVEFTPAAGNHCLVFAALVLIGGQSVS